jgi:gamma-glutamylputrescine oxidase
MDEANPASAYGETWYAATMVDATPRPALGAEVDAEACVIGGGLAGLTVAHELARKGWSVVLLEAGRIAAQASGRSAGFVLPGFAAGPDSVVARVGFDHAKDLWTLAQSGLDYVRNIIQQERMPGVDPQDGWLYVSKTDNGDEFTRLAALLGEFGGEIEGWPTDRVRAVLRSERYFHAIHYPRAISIHPLNYALGLAAAAERLGVRIYENTPALSMDPAGVRKRIVTPHGRLRANCIVLCGNLQIAGLMPQVAETLIPITTYVIATAKLGSGLGEAVGYSGAISDSDLADSHYRVVDGDRLMWSGRATTWSGDPARYANALKAEIGKTYPQLGKFAVEYAWSGTLGNPLHRMPQIGELIPGVWLASGFSGHGLNTSAMAGNLIARAVAEDDPTWKLFTPFELVWAGGKYGRALAQVYYWTRRLGDALAERGARINGFGLRRGGRSANGSDGEAHAVDAALPSETAVDAVAPIAEGEPPGADAAPRSAQIETEGMVLQALAAEAEAMSADDTPPPMIVLASRRDQGEKPEDADA